jgi:hypothetical protein
VHQDGPAEDQGLPGGLAEPRPPPPPPAPFPPDQIRSGQPGHQRGRLRRRPAIEYRLAPGHEHALPAALSTAAAGLARGSTSCAGTAAAGCVTTCSPSARAGLRH